MEKEFTKADLKDGMVIETRERGRYLVLGNIATRNNGYNKLSRYGDDLTEHSFHNNIFEFPASDCWERKGGKYEIICMQ